MGCLNSMFNMWINVLYRRRKILGVRVAKDCFRKNSILRALLAALTTLSSTLSLVFKTIPRSLVVVTVGMVWVLGGLWDGRV